MLRSTAPVVDQVGSVPVNDLDAQGPSQVQEPAEEQVKPQAPQAQRQPNGLEWLVKQAQRNQRPSQAQSE
jgi:hypothetical protein